MIGTSKLPTLVALYILHNLGLTYSIFLIQLSIGIACMVLLKSLHNIHIKVDSDASPVM
jgi:hypothetical protein